MEAVYQHAAVSGHVEGWRKVQCWRSRAEISELGFNSRADFILAPGKERHLGVSMVTSYLNSGESIKVSGKGNTPQHFSFCCRKASTLCTLCVLCCELTSCCFYPHRLVPRYRGCYFLVWITFISGYIICAICVYQRSKRVFMSVPGVYFSCLWGFKGHFNIDIRSIKW